jgi:hypothetical protein
MHLSPNRPHHVTDDGPSVIYVRIGSTNRRADEQLIGELRRSARYESFDETEPHPQSSTTLLSLAQTS